MMYTLIYIKYRNQIMYMITLIVINMHEADCV